MDELTYPTADPLCEQVRKVACMVGMRRAAHFVYAQVLEWQAGKTDADIQAHRKRTLEQLREAAQRMRKSGMCERWFGDADRSVKRVAGNVCGPLFEQLLKESGFHDPACADLFRHGVLSPICRACACGFRFVQAPIW